MAGPNGAFWCYRELQPYPKLAPPVLKQPRTLPPAQGSLTEHRDAGGRGRFVPPPRPAIRKASPRRLQVSGPPRSRLCAWLEACVLRISGITIGNFKGIGVEVQEI